LTYVGHACVGITIAGTLFLTDAILRNQVAFLRWTAPAQQLEMFRDVDAVLISHLHRDHCDLPSLAMLGHDRILLVPWGTDDFFRRHGFNDIVPMRPEQTHQVGSVAVTATEAAHDGRRYPVGPPQAAIGFVLAGGGLRLYFAGDTDLFPGMRNLSADLDVALLPVAGWGRTLGPGHLDPVRAAEAVHLLEPGLVVPIHWGSLRPVWHGSASGRQIDDPAAVFAAEVRRRQLPATVAVLQPGGGLTWPP
jgi:L-ascorbate metabolism protein UlaG (beta-lactamase superfamily)